MGTEACGRTGVVGRADAETGVCGRAGAVTRLELVLRTRGAAQHGVVARAQLIADGIPGHVIDRCVRQGRLVLLHRGVYQAGPVLGARGVEMAALLACGGEAHVSHISAAGLYGMGQAAAEAIDVTVPPARRRRIRGVRVHRSLLAADEVTAVDGIAVTTPGRTLLDLAGCVPLRDAEQALARAERMQLVTRDEVRALVRRHASSRGARVLRRWLAPDASVAFTRSKAEEKLLALVRAAMLPHPQLNTRVAGYEVDVLWPSEKVIVEVDGYAYHRSRRSFVVDRRRDTELAVAGYTVVRFTWADVTERREATLSRIVQVLARRAP
jgi:very-short-patch-repair endonuclease